MIIDSASKQRFHEIHPSGIMTQRSYHLAWFLFILFIPLVMSFLLPSLFYNIPVKFRTHDIAIGVIAAVELGAIDIFRATAVWVTWASIAIIVPILLSDTAKAKARNWSVIALWRSFVVFSSVGSAISLASYFLSLGGGVEQIFRQLSFSPAVATILGIKVLQERRFFEESRRRAIVCTSVVLLAVDVIATVVVPILLGKAAPAIYAGLAILYGLLVLRVGWKHQVFVWVVYVIFCVFALAYKDNFRTSWVGNIFWQEGKSIRLPVDDLFRYGVKEAYAKQTGNRKEMTLGAPLDLSYNGRPKFSYYDLNYYNIRFLSSEEEYMGLRLAFARSLNRISHLGDLANAIRVTPDVVPYLAGATYYPLLFKPIPRFLWKDKPEENSGQIYGHRYKVLDPSDKTTSANLSVVTEAWINGGWTVVVLSAFAFGLLIHLIWGYMIGEASGVGNVVLGMVFISSGTATESSMNLVAGGILYGIIVWWFIDYVIRTMDKQNNIS